MADRLMEPAELIGIVTGILAILGIVVGLTGYVTQLQSKLGQQQLEANVRRSKENLESGQERYNELEQRHNQLIHEVAIARRIGTEALLKKADIDDELSSAMLALGAQASSILVKAPSLIQSISQTKPDLVFLSAYGPTAQTLIRNRITVHGELLI